MSVSAVDTQTLVLIGPDALGWAKVDDFTGALSQFGLAMPMFPAGAEPLGPDGARALRSEAEVVGVRAGSW